MNVIETTGLGKRYGDVWALRDCTLALPAGHLAALVGPNGAGKTTLMNMTVGLAVPTAGAVCVLGGQPAGSAAALGSIAFVGQDTPLYKNLSARDMLHLTRNLNRNFDQKYAQARLADLGIPLVKKAGKLSGGQQAQLALTLALARRPQLLILDEPLAMLDPLARQDFMTTVLTAMTDHGVSVLLSSHALAELERVADYLILLSGGRLQVAGEVDDLLGGHRVLTGPAAEAGAFSALWTWFFQPFLKQEDLTVLSATVFDTRALSFAAWTLAAFSIGVLFGMLVRRTVPAMALTFGVYLGLTLLTWLFLRKHYLPALVTSNPNIVGGRLSQNSPWVVGIWHAGGTQGWSYQPVSRFWPMQFVEAGWLLVLSVLLIAATVWLVRRRAA